MRQACSACRVASAGCFVAIVCLLASAAHAVIIDSGDGAGNIDPPPDFGHWQHVEQRLGGTSIIHLGRGWVLTARHVGAGIVLFGRDRFSPDPETLTYFGDPDRPADLLLFRLDTQRPWPDLPALEIARTAPALGEEVLVIGNGRNRGKRIRTDSPGGPLLTGWRWGPKSNKRWGTNRVVASNTVIEHGATSTLAFSVRFDSLYQGGATAHEAQAADGDSGGAVFKRRDPDDPDSDWVLAGVMFTVNHPYGGPTDAAFYGDLTHAVDLTAYREALIERIRPACSNERDDDGDGRIDNPDDPGCADRDDDDERDIPPVPPSPILPWLVIVPTVVLGLVALASTRASRTPR